MGGGAVSHRSNQDIHQANRRQLALHAGLRRGGAHPPRESKDWLHVSSDEEKEWGGTCVTRRRPCRPLGSVA